MLIHSVRLQDFKSYVDAEIMFAPGVNAILGRNGAGKSSILEAIGFVLFNHTSGTAGSLLREGSKSGRALVRFISALDERQYEAERRFTASTTTQYRVRDCELNEVVAEGVSGVQGWMRRHLRLDSGADLASLFENTIGVPQGTMTAPFLARPAERRSLFGPLLQVSDYAVSADKLRETVRHIEQRLANERSIAARLEGQLEEQPRLEADLAAHQAAAAQAAARTDELSGALVELEQRIHGYELASEALERANQAVTIARRTHDLAQQRAETAAEAAQSAERARSTCVASEPGHLAYQRAEEAGRELQNARVARDKLTQSAAKLASQRAELSGQVSQLEREQQSTARAEAEYRALEPEVAEQSRLELHLAQQNSAVSHFEQAQRALADAQRGLERARQELERTRSSHKESLSLEASLKLRSDALEAARSDERATLDAMARAKTEIERIEHANQQLCQSDLATCPVCMAELTPEHRHELLELNTVQLEQLQQELAKASAHATDVRGAVQSGQREIDKLYASLRKLPAADAVEAATKGEANAHAQVEKARTALQALGDAPALRDATCRQLEALGNPRTRAATLQRAAERHPQVASELAAVRVSLEALDAEETQLQSELAAYAGLEDQLDTNQRELRANQPDHERYLANIQVAGEYNERAARARTQLAEAADRSKELECAQIEAAGRQTAYDAPAHAELRRQQTQYASELAASRAQLELHNAQASIAQKRLSELVTARDKLAEAQAQIARSDLARMSGERIRGWLKEAGPQITRRLTERIAYEASAIYREIMADTSGKLMWDSDYSLSLSVRGETRAYPQLSGGEQMAAALALRLALLRNASGIDLAIFDEPTAHLDAERRENLSERLALIRGFGQILVVSHDDTFERYAHHRVHIIRDERGSRPVEQA